MKNIIIVVLILWICASHAFSRDVDALDGYGYDFNLDGYLEFYELQYLIDDAVERNERRNPC
jgi:hypothetical protein